MTFTDALTATELEAFGSVNFNWTRQLKSIWQDPPYHVPSIHQTALKDLIRYFLHETREEKPLDEPLGRVVIGTAGLGKTHLIGELRRQVWENKGTFILLDFAGINDFWSSVALGFLNSLQTKVTQNGRTQYDLLLFKIASLFRLESVVADVEIRFRHQPREFALTLVEVFLGALSKKDRDLTREHQDVIRSLVMLISDDLHCASIAHGFLQGMDLSIDDTRALRYNVHTKRPIDIVKGISWLLSLVGPTMIAIDQIDAIISEASARPGPNSGGTDDQATETLSIIEALANGLMELHDVKQRAVAVISCLEASWNVLRHKATVAITDRYYPPLVLNGMRGRDDARQIVCGRLAPAYSSYNFRPESDAWPFAEEAFDTAVGFSARQLLKACEDHKQLCLSNGAVSVCRSFGGTVRPDVKPPGNELAQLYRQEYSRVATDGLLDPENEDRLRLLLTDALEAYCKHIEVPDDIDVLLQPDPDQARPSLHGRLAFVFRSQGDREQHFCFRIIAHSNAIAFQTRLRAAMTASGVDHALNFRHLFIIRRDYPPAGTRTAELVDKFKKAGGMFIIPTDEDLRIFVALQAMLKANKDGFDAWLRHAKPLFKSPLFQAAGLCPPTFLPQEPPAGNPPTPPRSPNGGPSPEPGSRPLQAQAAPAANGNGAVTARSTTPQPESTAATASKPEQEPNVPPQQSATANPAGAARVIPLGHRLERGNLTTAVTLPADLLARHIAILAGSGSGKTVLLRRIVEEAALLGLPAIVLDTNNDLARLGDAWPTRPADFTETDTTKAADYHRRVDVMIWTPGINSGRPMSLALLPDFATVKDDEEERAQAVEMARATLVPFVGARGSAGKLKEGVLADTLRRFAKEGGGSLNDFIYLLSELPDGVSQISNAQKHAAAMADQLHAAIATNPLLQSNGPPLDPQILFGASSGRPRVSVINFSGIQSDDARQAFVNQLQMSLFSWIKSHPSPTGRLYVLDEAQNFAPSTTMTPCKASTISLAAQARKYGLGMMFATQVPKGIDNKIVSNCTTHVYGRMSSPTAIEAVEDLMRAKGGAADDIGRLSRGEFYFSSDGVTNRPIKVRTPLCLTYHPANPLTAEEVVAKARSTS